MTNKSEDRKIEAIKTIKLNTKMYNLTALVVVFTLLLIIVNSVTSLVDFIPKYSIVALLFIVSILVVIDYYLSKKVAADAIDTMEDYEKRVNKMVKTMEKDVDTRLSKQEELQAILPDDELTGLHNMLGFTPFAEHYLKSLKRENFIAYILYADIDNMKQINDTYGHQEGDFVIKTVANTLLEIFRESDLVARIGGDEFTVLPVAFTESDVTLINNRLQKKLDEINSTSGKEYKISISYGLSEYNIETPCSVEELLARAKKHMLEQKKN